MIEGTIAPRPDELFFGRLRWLIRIRWFAIALAFCGIALFSYLGSLPQLTSLTGIFTIAILLNLAYHLVVNNQLLTTRTGLKLLCLFQLLVDILCLLLLVHFTGGLANPVLFFLTAPVILGGFFFQPRWAYLLAVGALGLAAVLGLLEGRGVLAYHPVEVFGDGWDLEALHGKMSVTLLLLGTLLGGATYLSTQIASTLRKREEHLERLLTSRNISQVDLALAAEQRREGLAGLARGIDREIRGPLGIIRARVDSMRYDLEDLGEGDSRLTRDLEIIVARVDQIGRTVDRITAALNPSTGEWKRLDLVRLLEEVTEDFAETFAREGISLRIESEPVRAEIEGDRLQLKALFESLFRNAREARDEVKGGKGSVRLRPLPGGESQFLVRIRDNGPGLPPEERRRIFDPFYSTRDGNRGAGFMLAYMVVRNHNGTLWVRSQPPRGLSVLIALPAAGG